MRWALCCAALLAACLWLAGLPRIAHAADAAHILALEHMEWLQDANIACTKGRSDLIYKITWTGPCKDGLLDGAGMLTVDLSFCRDMTLNGTFAHGIAEGRAEIACPGARGWHFEGELHGNRANGPGGLTYGDNSRIEGVDKDNELSGTIAAIEPDGTRFETTWRNNAAVDGPAAILYTDGTRQTFAMRDHHRDGHAVISLPDGSRLEYDFLNGIEGGEGILTDAAGHRITGPFSAPVPDPARLKPVPSRESRYLNEHGTVSVTFLVGTDGSVTQLRLMLSSGFPRLDDVVIAAVAAWRYQPARVGDHPVPLHRRVDLTFELK